MTSLNVDPNFKEIICNFPKMHGAIKDISNDSRDLKNFDPDIEKDIKYMIDLYVVQLREIILMLKLNTIFVNCQVLTMKTEFYLVFILRMIVKKLLLVENITLIRIICPG